uniref:L-2-hydroxyglutarate dehydrogenase, mitochondrial n=1 Tax=Albugo laibachii Nc14 TaxID=890382 RepID=F0W6A6_9STRA|nr:L2hydroxyglutarate dehydrogenase putative [Albugo laibachii Nc14]|eukprot:CCA16649.1 L2hydroxyglutarate dehydrogenase putative [Albugo laibachii Nc14]
MTPSLVIAGGGVIGLSIARLAAQRGLETFVLEKNAFIGQETTSRNSQVIHAGIYYPVSGLKARLCVAGKEALYRFCREHDVPYRQCGKLIVAERSQTEILDRLYENGRKNGVYDLKMVSGEEARAMEPELDCHQALFSPSTGIIDSFGLMTALENDAVRHGATILVNTAVQSVRLGANWKRISVVQEGELYEVESHFFVNATGLLAPELWPVYDVDRPRVPLKWSKGTYFRLGSGGTIPFQRLVYPVPEPGGLGIHFTLGIDGSVRFGPDVELVDRIEYVPIESRKALFVERIKRYWPAVSADDLEVDYCGIRPKIMQANGQIYEDFCIAGPSFHGVPGVVHLCGIESPGLTSALAIAERTIELLESMK